MSDIYKCCNWCKYYDSKTKCCTSTRTFDTEESTLNVHQYIENGILSEVIEESINPYRQLNFGVVDDYLAESKLPRKRIKMVIEMIMDEIEKKKEDLICEIDENVSRSLINYNFGSEHSGVTILHPYDFCCKYFN